MYNHIPLNVPFTKPESRREMFRLSISACAQVTPIHTRAKP